MRLRLVVICGPDSGTVFELGQAGLYALGRGDDCDIRLSDPRISRSHCLIDVSYGRAVLIDSDSSWGTQVNGERIASQQLQPGDILRLVESELRFEVAVTTGAMTWLPDQPSEDFAAADRAVSNTDDSADSETTFVGNVERQAGGGAETSPVAIPQQPSAMVAPARNDLVKLVGKRMSRYEILDVIARSRTGMLFRARDVVKNRSVAFKVLWSEITRDDHEVRKFVRAVKTVLGVKHPNLVTLYGAGKTRPRYCWTACELVQGESLMDVIRKAGENGQLPWRQCLTIGIHIARGLEAAHSHGFVHRNITPANILIRKSDGVAKLGDLMLAKALEGTQAERITRPGETVGDLPYISPEQLLAPSDVDIRSDIYSLGATLYMAVTGRSPVAGDSIADTVVRIESRRPDNPQRCNPAIPHEFAAVILTMLEKRPDDRYENPTQLVLALEQTAALVNLPPVEMPLAPRIETDPWAELLQTVNMLYGRLLEIPWPVRRKAMIAAIVVTCGYVVLSHVASMLTQVR